MYLPRVNAFLLLRTGTLDKIHVEISVMRSPLPPLCSHTTDYGIPGGRAAVGTGRCASIRALLDVIPAAIKAGILAGYAKPVFLLL